MMLHTGNYCNIVYHLYLNKKIKIKLNFKKNIWKNWEIVCGVGLSEKLYTIQLNLNTRKTAKMFLV